MTCGFLQSLWTSRELILKLLHTSIFFYEMNINILCDFHFEWFFFKYIVTKLIITFYIPVIHYCNEVKFVFKHLSIPYCTNISNNSIDVIYIIMLLTVTAPVNLVASSPSATQLTVSWTRPNNTVSSNTYIPDATASSWSVIRVLAYKITMRSPPKILNFSGRVLKR